MKKYFLISVLLVIFSAAATPPPPPTAPPIPTAGSNVNSLNSTATAVTTECPVGTPVGVGINTPDAFWQSSCGRCYATSTPDPNIWMTLQPTSSANCVQTGGIGTPTAIVCGATSTPNPATVTVTRTPTQTSISPTIVPGLSCGDTVNATCSSLDGGRQLHYVINTGASPVYLRGDVGANLNKQLYIVYSVTQNIPWGGSPYAGGYSKNYTFNMGPWSNVADQTVGASDMRTKTWSGSQSINNTGYGWINMMFSMYNAWGDGYNIIGTFDIYGANYVPMGTSTPTSPAPTPTGTPQAGYCSSIPSKSDSATLQSFAYIDRSAGQCLQIAGFNLGTAIPTWAMPSALADWVNSVNFPGVTICVFPAVLGILSFFGSQLDLSWLLSFLVVVFVVKHFISK